VRDEKSAPGWFFARSEAAWAEFQTLPMPGIKDENWRYSSSKKIELANHTPAAAPTDANTAAALAATEGLKERAARFVFVNDVLVESDTANLPADVVCVTFADALRDHSEVLKEVEAGFGWTRGPASRPVQRLARWRVARPESPGRRWRGRPAPS
jgi:Fe-S cluster assembly protein SufD